MEIIKVPIVFNDFFRVQYLVEKALRYKNKLSLKILQLPFKMEIQMLKFSQNLNKYDKSEFLMPLLQPRLGIIL